MIACLSPLCPRAYSSTPDGFILIGIAPLKTVKMTRYLGAEVPGVQIPDRILHRMEHADSSGNAAEEGLQIALELIERVRALQPQGVHGIHLMALGWEENVPRVVTAAGLVSQASQSSELSG